MDHIYWPLCSFCKRTQVIPELAKDVRIWNYVLSDGLQFRLGKVDLAYGVQCPFYHSKDSCCMSICFKLYSYLSLKPKQVFVTK